MSAVVEAAICQCGSIGAPKEIRQCPEHFHFWLGDKRMASIGSVIKAVLPTDYSMVPADVLQNALDRGKRVDFHFSEYLRSGTVQIPAGERADVIERLSKLIPWWDASGLSVVGVQEIVFSESDGIAGMMDMRTEDGVVDLKCVSALQPAYALQLGAYLDYTGADHAAILHCPADSVRLVYYDAQQCREWWRTAVAWWTTLRQINVKRGLLRG